ncbi:MAG TPA: hypothetical protein VM597_07420, partial [Gemmataceae bacterium]|nr:hypothetical protein [Gemmataceae bacterium]
MPRSPVAGLRSFVRPPLRIEDLELRDVPATFSPGNLAVVRMGDGSAALGSAATAVFIDEYSTTGAAVNVGNTTATGNPLPTTVTGANLRLTGAGSSTVATDRMLLVRYASVNPVV